ncbi:hypothetical protein RHMOL_Rhmol09G0190400 [Rhododendron molle]|uniref:Uncharacterized protein n=1 Tax=Rhododendron molle TaxID=49168 RepID=A0ACC0MGT7_RHOML|nr:hypothetical protein RHMOL_Rhmol09G0190400 [Rhododendron molle]
MLCIFLKHLSTDLFIPRSAKPKIMEFQATPSNLSIKANTFAASCMSLHLAYIVNNAGSAEL